MKPLRVCLLLLWLLSVAAPGSAAPGQKPNIILIFADDLGYGDPGCYGGKLAPTPAIDSLTQGGIRCTDGYATAPVCAPSRFGLLTGSYQQRFGMQWNEDQHLRNRPRLQLPESHRTLPEALREAGYVTGQLGKWNFVRDVKTCVDEARDVMDWEGDYFPGPDGRYVGVDDPKKVDSGKVQGIWGPQQPGGEYLTDRIGRHAVEFIEKHQARPFFLYLAFNAVHSPWQAKAADRERFAHLEPPLSFYAAMLATMDENIGRVLVTLKELGLEENTLVVFTADNGPAMGSPGIKVWPQGWPQRILVGSAGPLNGCKAQYLEGGIREPFIVRWPARLKAGAEYRQPVSTMDLYATFLAAAGAPVPAGTRLDGVNLLPYLTGEKIGTPHQSLYWKHGTEGAVREGDWKLVVSGRKPQVRLFNLAQDLGETKDLSAEKPELTQRLHQAWRDWSATLPPRAAEPPQERASTKTNKSATPGKERKAQK
ncbi:MAG: sulfatase-like hydrolase/transferase [Planctomycetes bacterium]|nr:sulfatase-like hydrolase/transferase [Planctomycetota bacterium]